MGSQSSLIWMDGEAAAETKFVVVLVGWLQCTGSRLLVAGRPLHCAVFARLSLT